MIKLLALMPRSHDGVTWYRFTQFSRKARELNLIDGQFLDLTLSEKLLQKLIEKADCLWAKAVSLKDLPFFKEKNLKKPLIIDIDDNYNYVTPLSDIYAFFGTKEIILPDGRVLWKKGVAGFDPEKNKKNLERIEKIIKGADLVMTTTFKMREYLLKHNKKVVVIPNCIDKKYIPLIEHKKDKIVRIGWAGGSSHFADLMSILPSLKKIMEKYPQVHYYQIGQWFGVVEKYIPKSRLHFSPWINADGHGYRLSCLNLDIGLCPLTDDVFNEYKSCIKWYEYSAVKATTLAKNMLPYNEEIINGENGLLYNDKNEFEEKLEFLILNPVKRVMMANNAYDFVYKYRNLDKIASDWAFVIKELVKNYRQKPLDK